MTIYIIERESGDGLETDLFTDLSLAEQWRDVCGGELREETTWDKNFTAEMIATHEEENAEEPIYRCPWHSEHTPGEDRQLTVHHLVTCKTNVAENAEVQDSETGDLEYGDTDKASCACGWSGTVKDMTVEDNEDQS